jgi:hypothetical protein
MADVDRCITQAYDRRVANGDAKAVLETCRMSELHQFVLDCGATFTNELYKLTQLSFSPFGSERKAMREAAEANIRSNCVRSEAPAAPAAKPPEPASAPPAAAAPPPKQ